MSLSDTRAESWPVRAAKRFLRSRNFTVVRTQAEYHYVPRIYGAAARKHINVCNIEPFGSIAKRVISEERTYLYYDRLYTIYQALANVRRLTSRASFDAVEIGVFRGGGTAFIASAMSALNIDGEVHAIDTFEGHDERDLRANLDARHATERNAFKNTSYESVRQYLSKFPSASVYKGRFQDHCDKLQDRDIGFVHLDVDIYEPTLFSLQFFADHLIEGGVVVVDDYGFVTCPGAKQAVEEFAAADKRFAIFHHLTGQCVLVRTG